MFTFPFIKIELFFVIVERIPKVSTLVSNTRLLTGSFSLSSSSQKTHLGIHQDS